MRSFGVFLSLACGVFFSFLFGERLDLVRGVAGGEKEMSPRFSLFLEPSAEALRAFPVDAWSTITPQPVGWDTKIPAGRFYLHRLYLPSSQGRFLLDNMGIRVDLETKPNWFIEIRQNMGIGNGIHYRCTQSGCVFRHGEKTSKVDASLTGKSIFILSCDGSSCELGTGSQSLLTCKGRVCQEGKIEIISNLPESAFEKVVVSAQ